nr:hypothetical protein CFP56_31763 [Quercus suber]
MAKPVRGHEFLTTVLMRIPTEMNLTTRRTPVHPCSKAAHQCESERVLDAEVRTLSAWKEIPAVAVARSGWTAASGIVWRQSCRVRQADEGRRRLLFRLAPDAFDTDLPFSASHPGQKCDRPWHAGIFTVPDDRTGNLHQHRSTKATTSEE